MSVQQNVATELEQIALSWQKRFRDVSADSARSKPSADRWSIAEVVGHLIDSACNNHQRFVRAEGATVLEFPKYDQNAWVVAGHYQDFDWSALVDLWSAYNQLLAVLIRHIPDESLRVPCTIVPYDTCTLEFLVTDYLDHLNHHLSILETRISASGE